MPVTALYAGLLAGLFLFLSARVIGYRRAQRVEIGDGEDRELLRRIRVHANFVEYTPFALILIGLAESMAGTKSMLHVFGIALLLGRSLHAYALSQSPHILALRVFGMVLTLGTIFSAAVACALLAILGGKLI